MTVRFRAEAADDVLRAREWYEEQRNGLGDTFWDAVQETVSLVEEIPQAFPEVHIGIHRALLGRFPYAVYYRQASADGVEIIACLHTRRSPLIVRRREG